MGSLSAISAHRIGFCLVLCVLLIPLLFLLHRQILLLSPEEGEAKLLGVDVAKLRLLILTISTLIVAAIVSQTGLVSFIGLLAPHGARLLLRDNGKRTMLLSGILGGILLTGADILARSVSSGELPVSIFTSLLGAPFLICLLVRKKEW